MSKTLRILQCAFEDKPSHRVDIDGSDFATEPHRFQGNRATARERIEDFGSTPTVSLADSLTEPVQVFAVLSSPVQDTALSLFRRLLLSPPIGKFLLFYPRHQMSSQPLQHLFACFGA